MLTTFGIATSRPSPSDWPGSGFWTPWWPFALALRWVLSWRVAIIVDHFSRALVAFAVFRKEPSAAEVCALLERAVEKAGAAPRHLITDRGPQFQDEYRAWCKKNGIRPRFGAVGKKRSIAIVTCLGSIVERFMLSFANTSDGVVSILRSASISCERLPEPRQEHMFTYGHTQIPP